MLVRVSSDVTLVMKYLTFDRERKLDTGRFQREKNLCGGEPIPIDVPSLWNISVITHEKQQSIT